MVGDAPFADVGVHGEVAKEDYRVAGTTSQFKTVLRYLMRDRAAKVRFEYTCCCLAVGGVDRVFLMNMRRGASKLRGQAPD